MRFYTGNQPKRAFCHSVYSTMKIGEIHIYSAIAYDDKFEPHSIFNVRIVSVGLPHIVSFIERYTSKTNALICLKPNKRAFSEVYTIYNGKKKFHNRYNLH